MDIVTLSKLFYSKYASCNEILMKENRPYMLMLIKINNTTFAIPFRSNIKHKFVYWTDKNNNCGLDFTKAVVITSLDDIDKTNVQIRQNEFNAIKGDMYKIEKKFISFLNTYKKAYHRQDIQRNKILILNSALQYFINYL